MQHPNQKKQKANYRAEGYHPVFQSQPNYNMTKLETNAVQKEHLTRHMKPNTDQYEHLFRRESQALNISKRLSDQSMLAYHQKMNAITTSRNQKTLQTLFHRVTGGNRCNVNQSLNRHPNDSIDTYKWPHYKESVRSNSYPPLRYRPRSGVSMSISGKDVLSKVTSPRRPVSDPITPTNQYVPNQNRYLPKQMFHDYFLDISKRQGTTNILTLDDDQPEIEIRHRHDLRNSDPFSDIEVSAIPAVLHDKVDTQETIHALPCDTTEESHDNQYTLKSSSKRKMANKDRRRLATLRENEVEALSAKSRENFQQQLNKPYLVPRSEPMLESTDMLHITNINPAADSSEGYHSKESPLERNQDKHSAINNEPVEMMKDVVAGSQEQSFKNITKTLPPVQGKAVPRIQPSKPVFRNRKIDQVQKQIAPNDSSVTNVSNIVDSNKEPVLSSDEAEQALNAHDLDIGSDQNIITVRIDSKSKDQTVSDEIIIKSVLKKKTGDAQAKKNVQFGEKFVKEVTKITYPWNVAESSESSDDDEEEDDDDDDESEADTDSQTQNQSVQTENLEEPADDSKDSVIGKIDSGSLELSSKVLDVGVYKDMDGSTHSDDTRSNLDTLSAVDGIGVGETILST